MGEEWGGPMYDVEPAQRFRSPPVLQCRRLSGHAAVVAGALGMAGWDPDAFRAYRAELEFPPAPCRMMMVCPAV